MVINLPSCSEIGPSTGLIVPHTVWCGCRTLAQEGVSCTDFQLSGLVDQISQALKWLNHHCEGIYLKNRVRWYLRQCDRVRSSSWRRSSGSSARLVYVADSCAACTLCGVEPAPRVPFWLAAARANATRSVSGHVVIAIVPNNLHESRKSTQSLYIVSAGRARCEQSHQRPQNVQENLKFQVICETRFSSSHFPACS